MAINFEIFNVPLFHGNIPAINKHKNVQELKNAPAWQAILKNSKLRSKEK